VINGHCLQVLWSGYGKIQRFELTAPKISQTSIIVKHIQLPSRSNHPRGWNTDVAHQRKLKSYEVESNWYQFHNTQNPKFKTAKCFGVFQNNDERAIILEDLDESGYAVRLSQASDCQIKQVIEWLAHFHIEHLIIDHCHTYNDLWETGTYWHLDTRPDELETLEDLPLKRVATKIDQLLNDCPIQTLVHGDAKLANFCFDANQNRVSAVDFQYVGKGIGVKDLAYFLGSCLDEHQCREKVHQYLDYYFEVIRAQLKNKSILNRLEQSWRALFSVAWTDFHRFVKGWSPDHWKINGFSEQLKKDVIQELGKGR